MKYWQLTVKRCQFCEPCFMFFTKYVGKDFLDKALNAEVERGFKANLTLVDVVPTSKRYRLHLGKNSKLFVDFLEVYRAVDKGWVKIEEVEEHARVTLYNAF